MVTTDIVSLSVLNEGPNLRLLQVLNIVVVGRAQFRTHAAVVAGDDDGAAARLDLGVHTVFDAKASLLDSIVEDGGVLVVANTTDVNDAVGGQDVLGTASGVLGSSSGDQLGVIVVEEVLEDALVLFLGEDSIVGLESVLFEEGLVADSLDIWKKVSPCPVHMRIEP
jgi:hypothetical protein